MINEEFQIEKKEKISYTPLPENIYQVELLDVNVEENETYDSKKDTTTPPVFEKQLKFQFTLLAGTDTSQQEEENRNLRGRNLFVNFVPTYLYIGKNGPNKLYQIIIALIGRELSPEEESTFTSTKINELVGMQCRVGVKNKEGKEGAVFSNIETYYKKEQDMSPLTPEEKERAAIKKDNEDEIEIVVPTAQEEYQAKHSDENVQNIQF